MEFSPLTKSIAVIFNARKIYKNIRKKEVIYIYKFDHRFYIVTNKVKVKKTKGLPHELLLNK